MRIVELKKQPGRETKAYPAENMGKITPEQAVERVRTIGLWGAMAMLDFKRTSKEEVNAFGELLMEERSDYGTKTWDEAVLYCAHSQMLRPRVVEIRRSGKPLPPMAMRAAA